MAIISEYSRIYDLGSFIEGSKKAASAVFKVEVKIKSSNVSIETGWLITDNLLVLAHGDGGPVEENEARSYYCRSSIDAEEVLADPIVNGNYRRLQLLRLRKSLPDRAIPFLEQSLHASWQIFILHYAHGSTEISLSIGNLVSIQEQYILYDADTAPGSTGAPILNSDWKVIGLHHSGSVDRAANQGIRLSEILKELRHTPQWPEIVAYHKLADLGAVVFEGLEKQGKKTGNAPGTDLLKFAVIWQFDPKSLPEPDRAGLEMLVSNPESRFWSLRVDERQRLIQSADSFEALRDARGNDAIDHDGQRVIDRVLKGPPFVLENEDEALLPYWLQVVRWFSSIVPELPTPIEVNNNLERRRIRSRFREIAGDDFKGRVKELLRLKVWFEDHGKGPMTISGIGGIGKSALIARFAITLPPTIMLLWLDFDRADLAPDDARSVLTLLIRQASVQSKAFVKPDITGEWQEAAKACGAALAKILTHATDTLLVLDGFEVAQYVKQYQEIWKVLEILLEHVPTLRVIVSGRAPVNGLRLRGKEAEKIHLTGMAVEDAAGWLKQHGVTDANVLKQILDIADGVPFVLKLAVHLSRAGGNLSDIPEDLPQKLVEGYLYQRILDRILNEKIKGIVWSALVLRRITAPLIKAVLSENIPSGMNESQVFAELSREMGLVDGSVSLSQGVSLTSEGDGSVLVIRPELRAATIRLLEVNNARRVREIDEHAARWYSLQDLTKDFNAAELVYHRLRLDDIKGAAMVWRKSYVPLLLSAENELPSQATKAKAWLHKQIESARNTDTFEEWEMNTAQTITNLMKRGLHRTVPTVLAERFERSKNSPLIVYDAWSKLSVNDPAGAIQLLKAAGDAQGIVGRDRALMTALLERDRDPAKADKILKGLEKQSLWNDRPDEVLERLAVRAARIRLTIDHDLEFKLNKETIAARFDRKRVALITRYLMPADLVLASLREATDNIKGKESFSNEALIIPYDEITQKQFLMDFNRKRQANAVSYAFSTIGTDQVSELFSLLKRFLSDLDDNIVGIITNLTLRGIKRWELATENFFIGQACQHCLAANVINDALLLSVAATLTCFEGQEMRFPKEFPELSVPKFTIGNDGLHTIGSRKFSDLLHVVWVTFMSRFQNFSSGKNFTFAEKMIREQTDNRILEEWFMKMTESQRSDHNQKEDNLGQTSYAEVAALIDRYKLNSVILYFLGPDPLEMLCRRVLNLPDTYRF